MEGKYATTAPTASSAAIGGRSMRSRCARRLRAMSALPELFQHVAEAAYRADADAGGLELGAQPRYVHLDRVRRKLVAPSGHRLDDRLLGDDLFHLREQHLQHRPFPRRKLERLAAQEGAPRDGVERERAVHDAWAA